MFFLYKKNSGIFTYTAISPHTIWIKNKTSIALLRFQSHLPSIVVNGRFLIFSLIYMAAFCTHVNLLISKINHQIKKTSNAYCKINHQYIKKKYKPADCFQTKKFYFLIYKLLHIFVKKSIHNTIDNRYQSIICYK